MVQLNHSMIKTRSVQPLWTVEQSNITPLYSQCSTQPIGVAFHLLVTDGRYILDSLPGNGIIGIVFSLNPEAPEAICYGVMQDHGAIALPRQTNILMCQFLPGEFSHIFGVPAHSVPVPGIELSQLFPIGRLAEQIAEAEGFESKCRYLQAFISYCECSTRLRSSNELARSLYSSFFEQKGTLRIKEIETQTGYSARYLQKIIQENVGLAPKTVLNNIRFQAIVRMIVAHPNWPLLHIAHEGGFYDQSHFCKFFKEMSGITPSEFLNRVRQQELMYRRQTFFPEPFSS